MLKYKRRKFNNKNILYTNNTLKQQEQEEKEKQKQEELDKLKELQDEFYSDDEDNDIISELIDILDTIKNKKQLITFVKEYKDNINNLEQNDKERLLYLIQKKYY